MLRQTTECLVRKKRSHDQCAQRQQHIFTLATAISRNLPARDAVDPMQMRCKLWGADSEKGQTSSDKTLLTAAACAGDAGVFQRQLAQGHDYGTINAYFGVPPCCAAVAGSYRIVETLLALVIDAYRQYRMASCKRDTPLKAAAYASHRDIVLLLPRSCTPIFFWHEHAIMRTSKCCGWKAQMSGYQST